ncbi:YigZ family protein [Mycoplasmatota bacterium WC44]
MKTIKDDIQNEIIIEKSRFICYMKRVESVDEATEFINKIKKDHWNASHNCSAFVIGKRSEIMRSSDDGEPSGTAGAPMLNSLKNNNLSDVVSVVTRYFGGTKLGAGGLIRAYSRSVSEAILKASIIETVEMKVITVTVDYSVANTLSKKIDKYLTVSTDYAQNVIITYYIRPSEIDNFINDITEVTNSHFTHEVKETIQYDLEIN